MKDIPIIQAKLKHKIEDFVVEEIGNKWICKVSDEFIQPEIKLENEPKDFLWCELEKKDIDHFTAMKELPIKLNKRPFDISYAGTKDKRAITSQRISIFQPDIEKIKAFNHPNIILKNCKYNKRKIKIGYLEGNHFKITLRDIDKKGAMIITKHIRNLEWFPNYFGPQRFGRTGNNVKIGKLILKRKFEQAAKEIAADSKRNEDIIKQYLAQNPGNFIGAIRRIDKKNTLMYINSVQSKIFNEILEEALKEGQSFTKQGQTSCLLVGYKSRFFQGRLGEIEQEVLARHNLNLEDFDITEIPYLRMKGSFRKAVTEIKDLEIETSDDEEFPGSKKIKLEFTLPSGVYATTFLENFFNFADM